jgi:hypothetical protein
LWRIPTGDIIPCILPAGFTLFPPPDPDHDIAPITFDLRVDL